MNAPLLILKASMLLFLAGIAAFSALFSSGVSFLLLLPLFLLLAICVSILVYVFVTYRLILDLLFTEARPLRDILIFLLFFVL